MRNTSFFDCLRQRIASRKRDKKTRGRRLVQRRLATAVETLEPRLLLAVDLGDAPDIGAGTGPGNYRTLSANGGPSHNIDVTQTTLFLGSSVDGDNGMLQNLRANADDVDGALPDDEDGVLSPLELQGIVGAAPTITLLVTNTTGGAATLSGWIDYNGDGMFDNTTERAQVSIPDGTTAIRSTLTFPIIPLGSAGKTYARFRLSTDAAAENATGAASDGEVEDFPFVITNVSDGMASSSLKIASGTGGPNLSGFDKFGDSVTSLGDLDGDGVNDLAVGASNDNADGFSRGAVHIVLMNSDGRAKSSVRIASGAGGGPVLTDQAHFGSSVASLGDLDGDGVNDLAIGALGDDTGGAVYVLLMNSDGTAKSNLKIANGTGGGPDLTNSGSFGASVTSLGDLDGDGVDDLAVGEDLDDTGGINSGAVYVLFMNSDGAAKSSVKISHGTGGGPTLADLNFFGSSVAAFGDLDGDGVNDLAVGAYGDDTGGDSRGAVHVLLMNSDGTAKKNVKIASGTGGGPMLADRDAFGTSVASLGDIDGDGVNDLAVGAVSHSGGRGVVYMLLMNSDGTAKSSVKIADNPDDPDFFGISVASLGDLDGDGVNELAVGADFDDTGGLRRGAVHILLSSSSFDYGDAPDQAASGFNSDYPTTLA
ncbi:MAG: integrin alpha [Candidatus Paceibacterota bacterium]